MNTAESFRRVRNLFDATLEKLPAERDAFLEDACHGDAPLLAQVRALLLAHGEPQTWIDSPALSLPDPRLEGRRIGAYVILREIGSGGMATVYLARRDDGAFHMRVALKVLRPESTSTEILKRFQQEREILASLSHPNIARILDGGETEDGRPYLAMEFIDGQPIDQYCDQHHLDVSQRLRLFRDVCAAVRFAHQRGVIHRDLKPSNILVTGAGVVKLLDFGIAKVLSTTAEDVTACLTQTGLCLMTPEYASPEQVRSEPVGTASDIYSLGVVLYELLTGHRPYRMRSRLFHEIIRVICEEPPTRPSTAVTEQEVVNEHQTITPVAVSIVREGSVLALRNRLAGDLDAVLLKTLQKTALQRYRSVEALDAEIARHLEGQPVQARRQRPWEQLKRSYQRYSAWIFAAFALGLLMLAGVVTFSKDALKFLAAGGAVTVVVAVIMVSDVGGPAAKRLIRSSLKIMGIGMLTGLAFAILGQRFQTRQATTIINLLVGLVYLGLGLRWPFRQRWAGGLLLNISRPRPMWVYVVALLTATFIPIAYITALRHHPHTATLISTTASMVFPFALILHLITTYGKSEIRQRGVVTNGFFIPWHRVEGRWWEGENERWNILKIQSGGFRKIGPPLPILVEPARRQQVQTLLDKYLNEWPAA